MTGRHKPLRKIFRPALPHRSSYYRNRILRRVSTRQVRRFLREIGVEPGHFVFLHSSIGNLGYLVGGPNGFLDSILEQLGPHGTLAMPAMPFRGSMKEFLDTRPTFDVRRTRSLSGILSELLRSRPESERSLHPTHSIAALGADAAEFLVDHETSGSPCGRDGPFGRFAEFDVHVLRVGTAALTLRHHLQEIYAFPNTFLDTDAVVPVVDLLGNPRRVTTRVYRPVIPNLIQIGVDTREQIFSVHPRDFPLLHPSRDRIYLEDPRRQAAYRILLKFRAEARMKGWERHARLGAAPAQYFRARDFLSLVRREWPRVLEEHSDVYRLDELERRARSGEYPR